MWGGGYVARLFLLFSFPCSADHERDWPPCKVDLKFGLATNTLNVRNNNFKQKLMGWLDTPTLFSDLNAWIVVV